MLEKFIIRLEKLKYRMDHEQERKRRERSVKCAKAEISRLARLRVI